MSLLSDDRATAPVLPAIDDAVTRSVVRVNLLPPEIAEAARLRRVQTGLGAGLLGVVGVVAALQVAAAGGVHEAQDELDALAARHTEVQGEMTEFGDVERVYAQAAAAKQVLAQAMGQEVRYSQLLDELSTTVPDKVWLTEVSVAQATAGTAGTAGAAGADGTLGTVTFAGAGTSHDDVAAWLDALGKHEQLADAAFSSSTAATTGGRRTVTFTSTATLTSAALSERHTVEAG